MEKSTVTIVGSGAGGVHAALTLLKKGYKVKMLDVGFQSSSDSIKKTYLELKEKLQDPVDFFLGRDFESVVSPENCEDIYGFPPNKQYIFKHPSYFDFKCEGFEPMFSFAQGGLAEAWTGGSYAYNDVDLKEYPFDYKDIKPFYEEVAQRMGLMGSDDDLSQFIPYHENILKPIRFDEHSDLLNKRYLKKREKLNKKGLFMGRSRVSLLSSPKGDRAAYNYSGRVMWGCPYDSFYVPSITLKECLKYSNFEYIKGIYVNHFNYEDNKISKLVGFDMQTGDSVKFTVDKIILAAGTLSSGKIFMESLYRQDKKLIKLKGLMDNRQILVPFVNISLIGKPYNPNNYQYHQLAVGITTPDERDYIHGQVTTLKTALMQAVLQTMPADYRTAIYVSKTLHSALGVANINLNDTSREDNYLTLEPNRELKRNTLSIKYRVRKEEDFLYKYSLKKMSSLLMSLGCIVPPGQSRVRPMGASVHYSGTFPMKKEGGTLTVDENCKSRDFTNLYFADGSSFPYLPSKNLTFTIMANAVRIIEKEF